MKVTDELHHKLEQRSFLLMLVLVSLLFLYLLKPFFGAVFWACAISLLFSPLYRRLMRRWPAFPNLNALLTLFLCVFIVVIPTLLVMMSFFQEGVGLYQRLQSGEMDMGAYLDRIRQSFPIIQQTLERFNIDLNNLKEQLAGAAIAASRLIAQNAVLLGQGTLEFFLSLGLMLYLAFFMLRDGQYLINLLVRALPLGDEREHLMFAKFAEVTRATVKGNLVVAAVQGALGGIIFWILGIPGPFLWGVVMFLLSLIPMVGAGLIWAPVALYLFAAGQWIEGLVLTGFGIGVIGLVDNVLRPILVGRDTKLPDYIVLMSTLGGFVLFGMNGFVIGPLIAALFVTVWEIFIREFNSPNSALPPHT
jgi:predicted PurR-regulated permease PerM